MGFSAITKPAAGITAPSLESGISLAGTATTVAFDLVNNDASNPTAIDLSFSSNYLEAASQHNGTAASPSYVLEAGETLPITLRRGSGAPSSGSEVCTVTALLADGSTATQSVTVHAAATVAGYVASLSAPTFELKFEGNTTNTGSNASAFSTSNTSVSASTAVAGLTGKMLFTGSNNAFVRFPSSLVIGDVSWSTDRSYIYIINFPSQPDANKPLVTLHHSGQRRHNGKHVKFRRRPHHGSIHRPQTSCCLLRCSNDDHACALQTIRGRRGPYNCNQGLRGKPDDIGHRWQQRLRAGYGSIWPGRYQC